MKCTKVSGSFAGAHGRGRQLLVVVVDAVDVVNYVNGVRLAGTPQVHPKAREVSLGGYLSTSLPAYIRARLRIPCESRRIEAGTPPGWLLHFRALERNRSRHLTSERALLRGHL